MKTIETPTWTTRQRNRRTRTLASAMIFALASLWGGEVYAQADNSQTSRWPYIAGSENGKRYNDRRDVRPGYRPGDQAPQRLRPYEKQQRTYVPGQTGSRSQRCPPGGANCVHDNRK